MKRLLSLLLGFCAVQGWAQAAPGADALAALHFLDGTWEAKAAGAGGATSLGTYTFASELAGHVYARHSKASNCNGPKNFATANTRMCCMCIPKARD